MHFRRVTRWQAGLWLSRLYSSLHGIQGCHLVFFDFLIPKMPKNTKIFIWQPRLNMISLVTFAGALTSFVWALPLWAPEPPHPGNRAVVVRTLYRWARGACIRCVQWCWAIVATALWVWYRLRSFNDRVLN